MQAFDDMIPHDSYPMYCLFIDLDPAQLDINVHPTKQEIKFEDEKIVYAFVQSAVKHALAQFSITPTLDFELDAGIQSLDAVNKPFTTEERSSASASSLYNTFTQKHQAHFVERKSDLGNWKDFYEKPAEEAIPAQSSHEYVDLPVERYDRVMQLHNAYIIVEDTAGYMLVNQQNAHERVLYERFQKALEDKPMTVQQSMFPVSIDLTPADAVMLTELLPDLLRLGYVLEPFGKNSFVVQGTPADILQGNEKQAIEKLLEQYKHFSSELRFSSREKLLRTLALQQSIRMGTALTEQEMQHLLSDLFACKVPNSTPNGKPTYMRFRRDELNRMFGR